MSFESPLPPYNASDPTASFLNSSCLDLLMIELVPMAWRVVRDVDLNTGSTSNPISGNANGGTGSVSNGSTKNTGEGSEGGNRGSRNGAGNAGSVGGGQGNGSMVAGEGTTKGEEEEQEERDAVFYRLEMLGYRVGQGLVER
jgi:hypothetical protein